MAYISGVFKMSVGVDRFSKFVVLEKEIDLFDGSVQLVSDHLLVSHVVFL